MIVITLRRIRPRESDYWLGLVIDFWVTSLISKEPRLISQSLHVVVYLLVSNRCIIVSTAPTTPSSPCSTGSAVGTFTMPRLPWCAAKASAPGRTGAHPSMSWSSALLVAAAQQQSMVVIDSNWRWCTPQAPPTTATPATPGTRPPAPTTRPVPNLRLRAPTTRPRTAPRPREMPSRCSSSPVPIPANIGSRLYLMASDSAYPGVHAAGVSSHSMWMSASCRAASAVPLCVHGCGRRHEQVLGQQGWCQVRHGLLRLSVPA